MKEEIYITIWKINCFVKHSRKPVCFGSGYTEGKSYSREMEEKFQNLCFPCCCCNTRGRRGTLAFCSSVVGLGK